MKGVSELTAAGLAILVLAIIVSISAQILGVMEGTFADTTLSGTFTVTGAAVNTTLSLGNPLVVDGSDSVVIASNGTALTRGDHPSGNYTIINYDDGTFLIHSPGLANIDVNATYSYNLLTTPRNITSDGVSAVGEFGNWFVIIALVLIAVFIIGLLLKGFGGITRGV